MHRNVLLGHINHILQVIISEVLNFLLSLIAPSVLSRKLNALWEWKSF